MKFDSGKSDKNFRTMEIVCEISGSRRHVVETFALLGSHIVYVGSCLPTFRDSFSVSSSRIKPGPRRGKVSSKYLCISVVNSALREDLCTFLRSPLTKLFTYLRGRKMFHARAAGTSGTRRKLG